MYGKVGTAMGMSVQERTETNVQCMETKELKFTTSIINVLATNNVSSGRTQMVTGKPTALVSLEHPTEMM
jgi:hypothetical protein